MNAKLFIAINLLALALIQNASANGITERCDTPAMKIEITRKLKQAYMVVDGLVNDRSVKVTPVIPKALLPRGQASVLAIADNTTSNEDGSSADTATFAAQFSVNYDTCEPAFLGSGRLE